MADEPVLAVRRILADATFVRRVAAADDPPVAIGRTALCKQPRGRPVLTLPTKGYTAAANHEFIAHAAVTALAGDVLLLLSPADHASLSAGARAPAGSTDEDLHRGCYTLVELHQLRHAFVGRELRCYRHPGADDHVMLSYRRRVHRKGARQGSGACDITHEFWRWVHARGGVAPL